MTIAKRIDKWNYLTKSCDSCFILIRLINTDLPRDRFIPCAPKMSGIYYCKAGRRTFGQFTQRKYAYLRPCLGDWSQPTQKSIYIPWNLHWTWKTSIVSICQHLCTIYRTCSLTLAVYISIHFCRGFYFSDTVLNLLFDAKFSVQNIKYHITTLFLWKKMDVSSLCTRNLQQQKNSAYANKIQFVLTLINFIQDNFMTEQQTKSH